MWCFVMTFQKKTWEDRLSEFPGRRLLKIISRGVDDEMVVDVSRSEGVVSRTGDAYSAANMNDLEQRIADGFDGININLPDLIKTASGSSSRVAISSNSYKEFSVNINIPDGYEIAGIISLEASGDVHANIIGFNQTKSGISAKVTNLGSYQINITVSATVLLIRTFV